MRLQRRRRPINYETIATQKQKDAHTASAAHNAALKAQTETQKKVSTATAAEAQKKAAATTAAAQKKSSSGYGSRTKKSGGRYGGSTKKSTNGTKKSGSGSGGVG